MFETIVAYVRKDFTSNPLRASCEIVGMACGVGASVLLAITTPQPLLFTCYILWMIASVLLFIGSISRGSTGLAIAYMAYFLIDLFGILNTVFSFFS